MMCLGCALQSINQSVEVQSTCNDAAAHTLRTHSCPSRVVKESVNCRKLSQSLSLPSPSQVRRAVIIIEYSGRGEMTQGCLNMTQGCLTAMDSRVRPNSQDPQSHGLPELNIQVFMLRIFHSASLIVRFRNLMDTATHWCSTELSTDRSSSKPRSQTLQACILSSAVPEASCSVHLIGKFGLIDAAPTTMTTVAPATGEHELD